ncbi:MAG TPA: PGF-CTERM sorting domain-containing protein [Candidatus Acidoferrales bacterium]|nr:PGF-CTERM sorting domain-containing protein [Candidatus Acidoferrales bacterium]
MNRARLRKRVLITLFVTLIPALTIGSISAPPANTTLVVTGISAPTYTNNTAAVNVTVQNTGFTLANSTFLVFENEPREITINNGGAFDIAPNSNATFAVKITAGTGASGNYDFKFYARSGNLTSESRTIYIQAGSAPVSQTNSVNPLPGFEAGFGIAALTFAAYFFWRQR